MIDVWWARRSYADAGLMALLDEIEHGRYASYRREEDRERFLVGCVLAKAAVAQRTGTAAAAVRLDRACDTCGKPHGKPKTPGTELSLSHSGDRIVVATAATTPVGIDVEEVRPTRDLDALAAHVLSENETTSDFFVTWTRKEAVTKATGDGLRVPFREVMVSAPEAPPRVLSWPYPQSPDTVTLFDLDAGPGYAAALAVLGAATDGVRQHDAAPLLGALER